MRFKPGQEAVCIFKGTWDHGYGPKYNEIVKIHDVINLYGHEYLEIYGYIEPLGNAYLAVRFQPIVSISELEEILNAQPETV